MGAQAAALLDAGGPVGDVPPTAAVAGQLQLTAPEPYDLDRVARGHGGVGLAPSAYDGSRLHRVLRLPDGPLPVVVHPDLTVTWSRPASHEAEVERQLRGVLALDDDLADLWDACDRVPSLTWVRLSGAGRVLRAPTAFEDLTGALASTNTSYAATRRMVSGLAGGGPFPTPDEVRELGDARLRELGWGYRAPQLLALASVDVEQWRDPAVPDDVVLAGLRALPGFGPFATATALPLMGCRPRPLVLDGWLRAQAGNGVEQRLAPMGRWAGTGLWLEITRRRGR